MLVKSGGFVKVGWRRGPDGVGVEGFCGKCWESYGWVLLELQWLRVWHRVQSCLWECEQSWGVWSEETILRESWGVCCECFGDAERVVGCRVVWRSLGDHYWLLKYLSIGGMFENVVVIEWMRVCETELESVSDWGGEALFILDLFGEHDIFVVIF